MADDQTGEHSDDRAPAPAQKQEKVEDCPNVSIVTPEAYPLSTRAGSKLGTDETDD